MFFLMANMLYINKYKNEQSTRESSEEKKEERYQKYTPPIH
jgi:hypothetical protein